MSKPTIKVSVSKKSNPTAGGSISVSYSCDVDFNNERGDDIGDEIDIWKVQSYSWSFSPPSDNEESGSSGSATISGLSAGQKVTIQGTVNIKFYRYEAEVTGIDDNGDTIIGKEKETYPVLSKSSSFPVYTHPGSFTGFSNISTGDIIEVDRDEKDSKGNLLKEGLSAIRVNKWCDHCNKYLSWKNQTASTTADACKVNSGDFITAAWYNKCAETCGISTRVSNDHTQSNSLITAECIKALGTAISS